MLTKCAPWGKSGGWAAKTPSQAVKDKERVCGPSTVFQARELMPYVSLLAAGQGKTGE